MAVVHHAARNVDVRDRVTVKQQLLMGVVEEKRRYRERADEQREARLMALLLVAFDSGLHD